ncbi:MAG: DUF1499 domain-containing protein [Gammaproteobacteria bacterium]|nr:DUF1499 domain-containing protein [Rhodocyclaceae bacterium]MBU3907754.1 DUF1499 domain-containing protein [Gammaproteobacteria bacterium]MBU3989814.1 DUF1499 domain-containing protein [Gammaproteobacteria bacterium]MBU4004400.1 DUF1499 domain-containing protein [Gammaproteobacteria bacterium]MBU4019809.1 DUF1499 domain-containing protein [Gammaproteobacteria bacterium]
MPLLSCAGKRPTDLGVAAGTFAACPATPNCVSSDASDSAHQVAPLQLAVAPAMAWPAVREFVAAGMPRTAIVTESADYLHVECRSAMLGFVDDLELHLRPGAGIIAVRSASRIGRSDFGVNRSRVEDLRAVLIKRGIVK